MMTEGEARALMARPLDVIEAAALLAVPVDVLAGLASAGAITLAEAWRAMRRDLEARLAEVRAARRGAYMRRRRAVERAARAVLDRDRAAAALAALSRAVVRVLDALALILTGFDLRLGERLPRIAAAVAETARDAAALRTRRNGRRAAR